MTVHIGDCVLGVFAFDESGKMLASKQFPREPKDVAGRLASIQMGTPTSEHRDLVKEMITGGTKEFTLESNILVSSLSREFKDAKFEVVAPNRAGSILRGKLNDVAEDVGFPNVSGLVRDVNFILTRLRLKEEASERDKMVIQSIVLLDEVDKSTNIIIGHLREWYSMHFPELDRLVHDHKVYLKLVNELGTRDKFTMNSVQKATELSEEEVKDIVQAAQSSIGADFDELDMNALQSCILEMIHSFEMREKIAEYVDGLMLQVAPNLRTVAGGTVGARLISLAGGLEGLSKLPSSTIQILGAEKALFRSLKSRARPPKHGVIYQYPEIRNSPRKLRGKIARALSGKIAIAARVDSMAGEYVGDKLSATLKGRVSSIMKRGKED